MVGCLDSDKNDAKKSAVRFVSTKTIVPVVFKKNSLELQKKLYYANSVKQTNISLIRTNWISRIKNAH